VKITTVTHHGTETVQSPGASLLLRKPSSSCLHPFAAHGVERGLPPQLGIWRRGHHRSPRGGGEIRCQPGRGTAPSHRLHPAVGFSHRCSTPKLPQPSSWHPPALGSLTSSGGQVSIRLVFQKPGRHGAPGWRSVRHPGRSSPRGRFQKSRASTAQGGTGLGSQLPPATCSRADLAAMGVEQSASRLKPVAAKISPTPSTLGMKVSARKGLRVPGEARCSGEKSQSLESGRRQIRQRSCGSAIEHLPRILSAKSAIGSQGEVGTVLLDCPERPDHGACLGAPRPFCTKPAEPLTGPVCGFRPRQDRLRRHHQPWGSACHGWKVSRACVGSLQCGTTQCFRWGPMAGIRAASQRSSPRGNRCGPVPHLRQPSPAHKTLPCAKPLAAAPSQPQGRGSRKPLPTRQR